MPADSVVRIVGIGDGRDLPAFLDPDFPFAAVFLAIEEILIDDRRLQHRRIEQGVLNLQGVARALHSVSPFATLSRGYAIVRDPLTGAVLRRSQDARVGQELDAQLAEGALRVTVGSLES